MNVVIVEISICKKHSIEKEERLLNTSQSSVEMIILQCQSEYERQAIDWYLKINVVIVEISICKRHSIEKRKDY